MDRRTFLQAFAGTGAAALAGYCGTAIAADYKVAGTKPLRNLGVHNEWGRLKEAVVGIPDDTVEMDYMPAMKWLPNWEVAELKKLAGRRTAEEEPEVFARLKAQIECHVKALRDHGVVVHRTKPMIYPEEKTFLADIQRGNMLFGGADFFGSSAIM